jgi:UDP-N-acetylglucosamine 2-epimerase (non-hydrolysing)
VSEACLLLDNAEERQRMSRVHNPYGDGQASRRIADAIAGFRSGDAG